MVAVNKLCATCIHSRADFICATDYCAVGNDDVMFEESQPCDKHEVDACGGDWLEREKRMRLENG